MWALILAIIILVGVLLIANQDHEKQEKEDRRQQEERDAQESRNEVAKRRAAIWAINGGLSQHNITGGKKP